MRKIVMLAGVLVIAVGGFSQSASAPTCEQRMLAAHREVIAIDHICALAKTCPPEIAPMLKSVEKTLEVK